MLEETFLGRLKELGNKVDCQNGEHLRVLNDNQEVARVSAFQPYEMNTIDCPSEILELIIIFSTTKYEDRHK
ncbi:hypothetical protein [Bacillus sp. MUM 13]|uniref:hypothetical protein n=1 Tax=Bacillus sp. MUM 13 TaxID=1678001 RepID=UPI0008F560E2|nr:hypothetical protein [Bacillus sp. MUM 13]OIK08471.1 hypothetical protein BIV59_19970 [Bacillus sp. MUM 13]